MTSAPTEAIFCPVIPPQQALQTLIDLTRTLAAGGPVDFLLSAIAQSALRILPARHASVRLLDETGMHLLAGARSGEGSEVAPVTFEKGQGIVGWVAEHGQPVRVGDCLQDPRFLPSPLQGFSIRSLLAVPFISQTAPIGVLAASAPEPEAFDADDQLLAVLVANSSVPVLEAARAERLSMTDKLTGAFTHRYLLQRLDQELQKARRTGAPLSLLALDLDRFKSVNLAFERAVGDRVLVSFAERVRQVVRRSDVLVRRGGEEFVVLMPGAPLSAAMEVANRIREATASLPLAGGEAVDVRVTVSVAVVEWDRVEEPDQLDQRAMEAVYEARRLGNNHLIVGVPRPG